MQESHSYPLQYYGSKQPYQIKYKQIASASQSKIYHTTFNDINKIKEFEKLSPEEQSKTYHSEFDVKKNKGDIEEIADLIIIFDGGDINGWESQLEDS